MLTRDVSGLGDLLSTRPADVARNQMNFGVALGVVGGLFLGRIVYREAFVRGLESRERKNIFLVGASALLWYGVDQLFNAQKQLDDFVTTAGKEIGIP